MVSTGAGATGRAGRVRPDHNKQLVRQIYGDIRSGGRLELVDEVLHPGFAAHDPTALPAELRGRQAFKEQTLAYRAVFAGLRFTIESLVAEGDEVVARWTASGTHTGSLAGESPTGRQVVTSGFGSWRVSDGRIIEHFGAFDIMGLLRQIGALPP